MKAAQRLNCFDKINWKLKCYCSLPHLCWSIHCWKSGQAWFLSSSARKLQQMILRRRYLPQRQKPPHALHTWTVHHWSIWWPSQPSSWRKEEFQWRWTNILWNKPTHIAISKIFFLYYLDKKLKYPLKSCFLPLCRILDVGVYEQAVHFRVDILNCNLEAVKASSLCHLNFFAESLNL